MAGVEGTKNYPLFALKSERKVFSYGPNVCIPPNPRDKAQTLSITRFRDAASKEVIEVKQVQGRGQLGAL